MNPGGAIPPFLRKTAANLIIAGALPNLKKFVESGKAAGRHVRGAA